MRKVKSLVAIKDSMFFFNSATEYLDCRINLKVRSLIYYKRVFFTFVFRGGGYYTVANWIQDWQHSEESRIFSSSWFSFYQFWCWQFFRILDFWANIYSIFRAYLLPPYKPLSGKLLIRFYSRIHMDGPKIHWDRQI